MSTKNPEILTINDVMNLLGISRSTVHRKKKTGELIGYKLGKKIYFKRSEIISKLDEGKVKVSDIEFNLPPANAA